MSRVPLRRSPSVCARSRHYCEPPRRLRGSVARPVDLGSPLPDALDSATAGPLLCGGITVFSPLLQHSLPSTARVGIIGIRGLGHMALQFASRWGCEVHAFTTSDSKEEEARKLGAHFVHNTRREGVFKSIAGSLDLILSTVNVPLDIPALLETLA